MNNEKNANNFCPINTNANIDIKADITDSVNKVTDSTLDVVKPPVKKSSDIITGLLSFVSETIDTGLYIYKENLRYHKERCNAKIKSKIDAIPKDKLTTPDIGIIGETMENLKYNLDKEYLVELYSNIIARNVDERTKDKVHPSFISIIKDLSFNDIKFLEALYKYQNNDHSFVPIITLTIVGSNENMNKDFKGTKYFLSLENYTYKIDELGVIIENLQKLNLISLDFTQFLKDEQVYESLKNEANILYKPTFEGLEMIYSCDCNVEIRAKVILSLTNLGQKLLDICLL